MIKHSPTPWTIEPSDEPENREIWDANMQCVACVYGVPEAGHLGPEQDQLIMDSRLIQAAPRMYELLRAIAEKQKTGHYWPYPVQVENILNDIEEPQ